MMDFRSDYQFASQILFPYINKFSMQKASRILNKIPTKLSHLNQIGQKLIPFNTNFDSLQYKDINYRQRRLEIGNMSITHKMGNRIREVDYTSQEHDSWKTLMRKINFYQKNVMSQTYLHQMAEMERELRFSKAIPRMNDVSDYLKARTGFQLKPVPGMIDAREFLNCLAFKVFCCGQFMRHHQCLEFAAEPDLVHEFVGHIPMFAQPLIAELSQKIGLLSLGASDEDIKKLGYAYLFTIELGLCLENNKRKAYGAAIASCTADLKRLEENNYKWKVFQPEVDCLTKIDDFQKPFECFYLCKTYEEAIEKLMHLGEEFRKPFVCQYDSEQAQIRMACLV